MLAYLETAVISMVIFMVICSAVMFLSAWRSAGPERATKHRLARTLTLLGFSVAAVLAAIYLIAG